jgi:hypothetical protein
VIISYKRRQMTMKTYALADPCRSTCRMTFDRLCNQLRVVLRWSMRVRLVLWDADEKVRVEA